MNIIIWLSDKYTRHNIIKLKLFKMISYKHKTNNAWLMPNLGINQPKTDDM